MTRLGLGLATALALGAGVFIGCEAGERPATPPEGAAQSAAQQSQEAASTATGAADAAAEAAQAAGAAAEVAEELSGEAASLLTTLGFIDDREVIQVLNTRIGTRITYVPATIVVTAGTGRKLSIFNDTEAPHGFRIPGLAVEMLLPAGEETVVELPPLVGPQIFAIDCHLHVPHRHASLVVLPARPSGD
jgi:hypothetical protein